jgi:hypothetical protein
MIEIHPNLELKIRLQAFWNQFGGKKAQGVGFAKSLKLAALVELSRVVIPFKNQQPHALRREKFDRVKAKLHKVKTHRICFACGWKAGIRHHIVQLQNGGINSKKNIVSLCDPCHAEIHPWLRHDRRPEIVLRAAMQEPETKRPPEMPQMRLPPETRSESDVGRLAFIERSRQGSRHSVPFEPLHVQEVCPTNRLPESNRTKWPLPHGGPQG